MDYSNQRDLSEDEKKYLQSWLKESLELADDVFLEYIIVMIQNGKTMAEIGTDLEAFIGDNASEFALRSCSFSLFSLSLVLSLSLSLSLSVSLSLTGLLS